MSENNATATEQELELRRVAIHEAGHAVAGIVLGREVSRVSIVPCPTEGRAGVVEHPEDDLCDRVHLGVDCNQEPDWSLDLEDPEVVARLEREYAGEESDRRRRLEREVVILYAGPEAEALLFGHRDEGRSSGDLDRVAEMLCRFAESPGGEEIDGEDLRLRARAFVADPTHRRLILALASALLVEPEMTGERAHQLVEQYRAEGEQAAR